MYIKHFEKKGMISRKSKIFHYCLMAFGIVCSALSNYAAIKNIVTAKHKKEDHKPHPVVKM